MQTSGDEITLKISRLLNQQPSKKNLIFSFFFIRVVFVSLEDYTPSVDSAMESWNSSNGDNRLSDHSDTTVTTTKEIIVNDHQQYSNGS